jgi:5-deoxy-D-glucuronate isomerase
MRRPGHEGARAIRCGFAADRLIAVEVLTPAGNWSSYPPHKHDEERDNQECALEEIYYYEVAQNGFAYQRVYTSDPKRQIDLCVEVRTGDVVTVPHGYHGPSMAAPGYDLYYLNVMGLERARGPRRGASGRRPTHRDESATESSVCLSPFPQKATFAVLSDTIDRRRVLRARVEPRRHGR